MVEVMVLGAGGILGQHMLVQRPYGALYCRAHPHPLYAARDLTARKGLLDLLAEHQPDVIVNLAGENQVDVVEGHPEKYGPINVGLPTLLAAWCERMGKRLIHVSSQGVFSGEHSPYGPDSLPDPIHAYGRQKAKAEQQVRAFLPECWTIARVTFVLGVRPFPALGRRNPVESMFAQTSQRQVDDRWFSPAFASDVASALWDLVDHPVTGIVHLGVPASTTRFEVAFIAAPEAEIIPVKDAEFAGADRPRNTTWAEGAIHHMDLETGLATLAREWHGRLERDINYRSRELSLYFGIPHPKAMHRLAMGFLELHHAVAADFEAAAPGDDDAKLLDWYMNTDAYIWELSAYHLDPGFNYKGMCSGIVERLTAWSKRNILVLGDGIGDLSLDLAEAGLEPVYHDLRGSRTAEFAQFRFHIAGDPPIQCLWTDGWDADFGVEKWDTIIALDFFEHLTEVEQWVRAAYRGLRPGGFFMCQNAFAIGDNEHGGSIPMHLVRNNRFEFDWTPLLESVGFTHDVAEWWVK